MWPERPVVTPDGGATAGRPTVVHGDRERQFGIVTSFLYQGLASGERCLYAAGGDAVAEVRTVLRDCGIDTESARDGGALSLHADVDPRPGTDGFDRTTAAEFWAEMVEKTRNRGFDGLRTATEMTWPPDWQRSVGARPGPTPIAPGTRCTALCRYGRSRPRTAVAAAAVPGGLSITAGHRPGSGPSGAVPLPDGSHRGDNTGQQTLDDTRDNPGQSASPANSEPPATPAETDRPVRVLFVDDQPGYAEVAAEYLERHDGIDRVVPETDPDTVPGRLETESVDCVVSDYAMPELDGLALLELVREEHPDLPFVMMTGHSDEETAIEAISTGVTAYFRKQSGTDQYTRLAHRISNAVEQYRTEQEIAATRRQYTRLIEESTDVVTILDEDGQFEYLSPAATRRLGYTPAELVDETVFDLVHPGDRGAVLDQIATLVAEPRRRISAEFRFEQPDGSWLWVEARGRNLLDDPDIGGLVIHARDITARRERETALRESEQRFRSLFEKAFDAMGIVDGDGEFVDANPAACELLEVPRETLLGQCLTDAVPEAETLTWPWQGGRDPGRGRSMLDLCTRTGTHRTVELATTPNIVAGRHLLVLRDVTDREQYEQTLTAVHDSSRDFLDVGSTAELAESIADTAVDVLSMPVVVVYLFDPAEGALVAEAGSDAVETSSLAPLAPGQAGVVGELFLDADPQTLRTTVADTPLSDLPPAEVVLVPLGDHGVCVVGDTDSEVTDVDRELVETLMTTAGTALDRVKRGVKLRERKDTLEARNRQLEQLRQLSATAREISQTITQADTRADVEQGVCRLLSASDGIALVQVSEHNTESGCLVHRERAGDTPAGGHQNTVPVGSGNSTHPGVQAATTGEPVYVANTASRLHEEPWRKTALSSGFRSVLAVPLTYRSLSYGTLTVYAEQAEFFDELSRLALVDLGQKTANVTNAVEHQNAVLSGAMTEVTVRFTDERIPLYRIASRVGCSLTLETATRQSRGAPRKHVRVDGADPATVADVAATLPTVSGASVSTDTGGDRVVELEFAAGPLTDSLADRGIRVLKSAADAESATLTLAVPDTVDVRELFDDLSARYGDAELVAKSERGREDSPAGERYRSTLTPRQREVLRTAHSSGFFESPRACTGEDVAADLDISPQTFYRHIRTAERKLFDTVFQGEG